jgi:hypothetical protein
VFRCWDLNSGPTSWATQPTHFFVNCCFEDRVSQTIGHMVTPLVWRMSMAVTEGKMQGQIPNLPPLGHPKASTPG